MRKKHHLKLGLMLPLALAACGQLDTTPPQPSTQQTGSLDVDLTAGSRGDDVVALQDYLGRYGYFPNATFAREYPAWRPATNQMPARGLFDDATVTAVKALQKNSGLPQTGVADADTRALVKESRCGVPDGIPRFDRADKFSTLGTKWASSTVSWKLTNTDDVTFAQAEAAMQAAFAAWNAQTNINFTEVTNGGAANITINFAMLASSSTLASTSVFGSPSISSATVTFNTTTAWSVARPLPGGTFDVQTIATHELGHAIGLGHSSFSSAIMFGSNGGTIGSLDIDDTAAVSALYDLWTQLAGGATDVARGANGASWIIGTTPNGSGDFGIYQRSGGTWIQANGAAVRIAVDPSGVPWVINSLNQIYRRTTNSASTGTWTQMPGSAKDIGIGFDGSVWIVSTLAFGGSDFQLQKFNGSTWDTPSDPGGAVRIAVGPDGVPWVVNASNQIYRRTTNVTTSGTWTQLPGFARDIGVGGANAQGGRYAWIIGTTAVGGGNFDVYVWNEQPAGGGSPPAPQLAQWLPFPGGAVAISVGPNATPLVANAGGGIFEPTK